MGGRLKVDGDHSAEQPARQAKDPSRSDWLADELEFLHCCPACGGERVEILHEDLRDKIFYCAAGRWTMWRCSDCECGYLNPRPSRASIHLAYAAYFTHAAPQTRPVFERLGLYKKLTRRLENGYTRARFGNREQPAAVLFGVLVFFALFLRRQLIDWNYRNLPVPRDGARKLLDLGCGNGEFLQRARNCGWDTTGIDPDPEAVMQARCAGLNVLTGGIEQLESQSGTFDVITLSHVLEHLHDPVGVLVAAHRLLKPSGRLWLETPNINGAGHDHYQKDWRGLEPPRHLVLFSPIGLELALRSAGFAIIKKMPGPRPGLALAKASEAIRQGLKPEQGSKLTMARIWAIKKDSIIEFVRPARKDFLTVVAIK